MHPICMTHPTLMNCKRKIQEDLSEVTCSLLPFPNRATLHLLEYFHIIKKDRLQQQAE